MNVETPPAHFEIPPTPFESLSTYLEIRPNETKDAPIGSNVRFICGPSQSAGKYRWTRAEGIFKIKTNIRQVNNNHFVVVYS